MAGEETTTPTEETGAFETGETTEETTDTGATEEGSAFSAPDGEGDEDKSGEDKSDEDGKTDDDTGSEQEGAPETYADFTLPSGTEVHADDMEAFKAEAREAGLSQEKAQERLDLLARWKTRYEERALAYYQEQQESWTAASRKAGLFQADNMKQAKHALSLLDPDGDAGKLMHSIGLDRHPAVIRAFAAYGREHSEDDVAPSGPTGSGEKTLAEKMFG